MTWHNRFTLVMALMMAFIFGLVAVGSSGSEAEPAKAFEHLKQDDLGLTPAQEKRLQKIKSERTAETVTLVKIPTDAFSRDSIELNVSPDSSVVVNRTSGSKLPKGFTWVGLGKSAGGRKGGTYAHIVARDGKFYGQFRGDQDYTIEPLGNGIHALVKRDLSKLPAESAAAFEENERKEKEIEREENPMPQPDPDDTQQDTARYATLELIDVMIVYTEAVEDEHGGNMDEFLETLIDKTNDTYRDSEISIRLRLCESKKVNYTESGKLKEDHKALIDRFDEALVEVHRLRNIRKADIVVMLVSKGDDLRGYAGTTFPATAQTAFAVVLDEAADKNYTFAHEIGHLQGAGHNPGADSKRSPFSYGHGFKNCAEGWRTIMTISKDPDCKRIGRWSNPMVRFSFDKNAKGSPTGIEDECDNARVLRKTAPDISQFR